MRRGTRKDRAQRLPASNRGLLFSVSGACCRAEQRQAFSGQTCPIETAVGMPCAKIEGIEIGRPRPAANIEAKSRTCHSISLSEASSQASGTPDSRKLSGRGGVLNRKRSFLRKARRTSSIVGFDDVVKTGHKFLMDVFGSIHQTICNVLARKRLGRLATAHGLSLTA